MRLSGFSLVELSIVLVILGLLVGGVLGGQSLIRAAELRNVLVEDSTFLTAVNSFKLKYNALPGDMPNATAYWAAAHATPATCLTTAITGAPTCNGDGNGVIRGFGGTSEHLLFWHHLSNAGLIAQSFTGTLTNNNFRYRSKLKAASWNVSSLLSGNNNMLSVYSDAGSVLTPPEMHQIDGKADDGVPNRGAVQAEYGDDAQELCRTDDGYGDEYLLSSDGKECIGIFLHKFY